MNENADALLKDPACQKSKEHFQSALRILELVQTAEIEMLLETIIGVGILRKMLFQIYWPFNCCFVLKFCE